MAAKTATRPTPAPWQRSPTHPSRIVGKLDGQPREEVICTVYAGNELHQAADAALIVAACNACQLANPQNPQAVAGGLTALIEAANVAESFLRHMTPQAQGVAGQQAETLLRAALASIETQETP